MNPQEPTNDNKTEPATPRGKLLTAAEISDWGNNTRMVEPGAKTEDGRTIGGSETEEDPTPEPEETVSTVEDAINANDEPEEEPATPVENPGEFTPKDYSFEVTVYDQEGKNGKSVTIKSTEAWDDLLETDPNLGSAAALAKGLRLAAKMEGNLEREKADHDSKKAEYDKVVADNDARVQATNNMVAEISYLVENKDLPEIDSKYTNADWSDPEIAKQPGIKEQIALLSFMRNENNRRTRLGLKPMTSILDAFNAYERQNAKTASVDSKKLAGEQRKAAGSIVASPSPSPQTAAPKGISVGRGGNLRDLSFNGW